MTGYAGLLMRSADGDAFQKKKILSRVSRRRQHFSTNGASGGSLMFLRVRAQRGGDDNTPAADFGAATRATEADEN